MVTLGTVKFLQVLHCSLEARHTRRKARSQLRDVICDFLQKSIDFKSFTAFLEDNRCKKVLRVRYNELLFLPKCLLSSRLLKTCGQTSWVWGQCPGFKTLICLGTPAGGSAGGPSSSLPFLSQFSDLGRFFWELIVFSLPIYKKRNVQGSTRLDRKMYNEVWLCLK